MALVAIASLSILSMSNAINVIYSSVNNIYYISSSLICSSKTANIENIIDFMERTNLQTTLEIYTALLDEIRDYDSKAVNICVNDIKKVIQAIELELIDINNKRIYNNSLYTGTKWLAYTFKSNVKKLEILSAKLDKSIETLKTTYTLISSKLESERVNDIIYKSGIHTVNSRKQITMKESLYPNVPSPIRSGDLFVQQVEGLDSSYVLPSVIKSS